MKSLLIALLAVGSLSLSAGVNGTKHDLSTTGFATKTNTTQTCVFCHTPHGSAVVASQQAQGANGQKGDEKGLHDSPHGWGLGGGEKKSAAIAGAVRKRGLPFPHASTGTSGCGH